MKARIRETNTWITVDSLNNGIDFYDVETHEIYDPSQLDFSNEFDWASFRREAAKEILPHLFAPAAAATNYELDFLNKEYWCGEAIKWADELIRQLKEEQNTIND